MSGRLSFWGQSLLREEEIRDWRNKLDALKAFSESLAPYNTVGKLKNLRIGSDDIAPRKRTSRFCRLSRGCWIWSPSSVPWPAYLSQAEMVLCQTMLG
jgi:hypothetical protein